MSAARRDCNFELGTLPRQRNLWVTETFERRLEARLAQSANPMPEYSGLGFCRSQLAAPEP